VRRGHVAAVGVEGDDAGARPARALGGDVDPRRRGREDDGHLGGIAPVTLDRGVAAQ
jgi:hypothetical protein